MSTAPVSSFTPGCAALANTPKTSATGISASRPASVAATGRVA